MEKVVYITTEDNPWDPFSQWEEWMSYDIANGYFTNERLARLAHFSEVLPDIINDESIEEAMNLMIQNGTFNSKTGSRVEYKKITKEIESEEKN